MKKFRMSLIELLMVIGVVAITGSMSTKLFFGFIKQNKAMEVKNQNQIEIRNIVRSYREWAAASGPEIDRLNKTIISRDNEILVSGQQISFKIGTKELKHQVPPGYTIKVEIGNSPSGNSQLVLNAERKGLNYNLKLPLGGEYEKE